MLLSSTLNSEHVKANALPSYASGPSPELLTVALNGACTEAAAINTRLDTRLGAKGSKTGDKLASDGESAVKTNRDVGRGPGGCSKET